MMKDMTRGNISSQLIRFSIPLVLGNLFQLTYNAVDSIVVGRFAGEEALAAVGAAGPVMNIVILGITGICIGASVLMSEFFGAGSHEKLKREISTTLLFGLYFSLAIVGLGLLFSGEIIRLLRVPKEISEDAAIYLRVILIGTPFTFFYNGVASALRSVGDSKTPVRFLAMASVLNALLDLVFVAGFHMGVFGAALATDIAEAVSALLCISYIYKKVPLLKLKPKDVRIDRELLSLTVKQGAVTALQQSCQPIGKLLIQGVINPLGVSTIAAFQAVNRVDDYAFTPEQSISSGMMTFVAQNRGASNGERIKKGFRTGLFIEAGYWVIICIVILLIKEPVMRLFVSNGDGAMVKIGAEYLSLMAFFYVMPAFTNGIQGFFRGMGNMSITLISTLIQISVRVALVVLLVPSMGMKGVPYACLAGWTCMLLYEIPYYFWFKKKNELLQEKKHD
ncbi:MATE family efflux transporter [Clostridium sp. WB02_MRS01]|uniref:MATE family efflux transporter n=1 Tax=Clostridium sp. WB02_MRS01 TaxID=2605777 RepID=UPI0012B3E8CA|nr:MATE family efflux transporter [Clostridium sp. WB02_MRS01]MSS09894.1 MATE family efflux transporter [Clostridium sp. WB02_MRS01]